MRKLVCPCRRTASRSASSTRPPIRRYQAPDRPEQVPADAANRRITVSPAAAAPASTNINNIQTNLCRLSLRCVATQHVCIFFLIQHRISFDLHMFWVRVCVFIGSATYFTNYIYQNASRHATRAYNEICWLVHYFNILQLCARVNCFLQHCVAFLFVFLYENSYLTGSAPANYARMDAFFFLIYR